jgi:hypothetical protein
VSRAGGGVDVTEERDPRTREESLAWERTRRISLVVHFADGAQIVPLTPGQPVTVGRGDDVAVSVDDRSLSREHARFELGEEGVVVLDLGSTNGTKLDGELVTRAVLRTGAEVRLGGVTVAVHAVSLGRPGGRRLVDFDGFRAVVEAELTRARFFRRSAALLLVGASEGAHRLRAALPRLEELLRPIDTAALYAGSRLCVLLPELELSEAEVLARSLAMPSGSAAARGLLVGVAAFPRAATSAEELFDVARGSLQRATLTEPVVVGEALAARTEPRDARKVAPVCESPKMRELYKSAAKIARSSLPVLLLAETGAGKEVEAVIRQVPCSRLKASFPLVTDGATGVFGADAEAVVEGTAAPAPLDEGAPPGGLSEEPQHTARTKIRASFTFATLAAVASPRRRWERSARSLHFSDLLDLDAPVARERSLEDR